MSVVERLIRLKLRVGDKQKKIRVAVKQRSRSGTPTLDRVPNRSKVHDDKQKKTLDVVPWRRKLRVGRHKRKPNFVFELRSRINNALRKKLHTRSSRRRSCGCWMKQMRERHLSRVQ